MAVSLPDLPKFLVLEPMSTIRLEIRLAAPACEIDVELENPRPGRSFVLLLGHKDGPFVQRVRLAGKARIYFDPQTPGEYVLLVANPQDDPIVLQLKARDIGIPARAGPSESGKKPVKRPAARGTTARRPTSPRPRTPSKRSSAKD